jgi:glycine cleavage system H protein
MTFPEHLFYSKEHMWVEKLADNTWNVGITDYAQDLLGDIVFVDAPKVGSEITASHACGLVESVKTGSDLHAPLDASIVEVNEAVLSSPELINDHPYTSWIFKCKTNIDSINDQLISADDYKKLIND